MTDRKSTRLNSSHLVISYAAISIKHHSYSTSASLSLHDALPISPTPPPRVVRQRPSRHLSLRSPSRTHPARGPAYHEYHIETGSGVRVPGLDGVIPWLAHAIHDRSEEHTSELQSPCNIVCRHQHKAPLLLNERFPFPTRRSSDLSNTPATSRSAKAFTSSVASFSFQNTSSQRPGLP